MNLSEVNYLPLHKLINARLPKIYAEPVSPCGRKKEGKVVSDIIKETDEGVRGNRQIFTITLTEP